MTRNSTRQKRTPEAILEGILDWALQRTGSGAGVIALYDELVQGVRFWAWQGYPAAYARFQTEPWPLDQGIVGRVLRTGEPAVVNDVAGDPNYLAAEPAVRSQLTVPIWSRDRVVGAINVESLERGSYGVEDRAFVQRLAGYASLAWENAQLQRQLGKAERARSEFIDLVAHELKQPMTSMQGYAKMLRMGLGGELTDAQLKFVQVIASNAERMDNLVSSLLEISRLEDGRIQLELEAVQLQEIVHEALAVTRDQIEARNHRLVVDVPQDVPQARGDGKRLVQILTHLITNACQYTPEGGTITLVLNGWDETKVPAGHVLVSVRDTGIGMSAKELARLGDKFYRGGHELVRSQPGAGLGVCIARQLVALHEGTFLVESQPGQGSTFRFTVPSHPEPVEGRYPSTDSGCSGPCGF